MRLEVDSGGYVDACGEFYDANHGIVATMSKLVDAVDGAGGMAGTDTGGEEWAARYDEAAGPLVQAGCQLGEAMAKMGNLLNASLVNHKGADYAAQVYGSPSGYEDVDGDTDPNHYGETLSAPDPPSAKGGTGDQPGWWHWIASHVEGLLWPDADTGQLRSTGQAWVTAGNDLAGWTYAVDAASGAISTQKSPEVGDVTATCSQLKGYISDLSHAFTTIGNACTEYADQVDAHHKEVEDELQSFLEWTAVIEGGGAVLGFFTAGLSELGAQAAEGAEVANAASKVVRILRDLIELARLGVARIGEAVKAVAEIGPKLAKILNARVVKAAESAGRALERGMVRARLKGLPGFTRDGRIDPAAFKTEPDSAFFWSGRTNGVGGEKVAGDIAGARGGTTLEQLMERRGIQLPKWDPDNPEVVQVWKDASAAYADEASGTVRAVIGDSLRPGNVWQTAELPALESNPAVTKIIEIDPVTKVEKVVYP